MHYHNCLISASLRQIWVRRLKQVGKAVGRVHDELRILTHSNSMGGNGERKAEEAPVDNFIFCMSNPIYL